MILPLRTASRASSWSKCRDEEEELLEELEDDWLEDDDDLD